MADFSFLQDNLGRWTVLAPKRAKRPDQAKGVVKECPFEADATAKLELLAVNEARVIANKYPFAPIHEIIIHSSDHHKSFDELTISQNEDIFKAYRFRFDEHKSKGQVYIFHNQGKNAGESLPHPHTQLVVVPNEVRMEIPALKIVHEETKELPYLYIFCPNVSQWPDEVWIAPRKDGKFFYEASDHELKEMAFALGRMVQIFTLRHGHDFPFNFYIYPGSSWYLRMIPRVKMIGGFEVGTGVFVNTQAPAETFQFIKEHFDNPDFEIIKSLQQADYGKTV